MKIKIIKFKSTLIIVFSAVILGAGFYFLLLPQLNQNKVATAPSTTGFGWKYPVAKFPSTGSGGQLAYSDIRDPGGVPQGLPVRLKIPAIGVDSAIEDALITPDGRMDVPAGSVNVAWFSLGPHPGQVGSAVIGGHFGINKGVPFVFYNLDKLNSGDKIYIVDDRGDTLAFQVRSISSFDRNADATTVFTSNDGLAHLNLITCEGIWNQVNGNYPLRLVIFTDAIPAESAGAIIASFHRSLGVGASGKDVAALQTVLLQKGFLTMPLGAAKGFFGSLTRDAVAKYQTSVGLSPVGLFGPLTRARLISESNINPVLPNTGTKKIAAPTFSQNIIQFVKSFYETPSDGLITLLLLFSIIFISAYLLKKKYR